ncbi:protein SAWADEE HOMEODOMAIN HOMOLOG 1 [Quercus suber]|uniref:protein SAWADEE HOMEODOMAIN HOMOLOG 1 n=1 Tax=Quercus suber TaxID=58331 RepID=UPI0032DF27C5
MPLLVVFALVLSFVYFSAAGVWISVVKMMVLNHLFELLGHVLTSFMENDVKDEEISNVKTKEINIGDKNLVWLTFLWLSRYDVASFLSYRVLHTGELEVRVRYAGFGKEDDEWVNVKNRVRERSIPLEASDCHKVKVGDLVLCFQEREHHAVYCDAYIVKIKRMPHDNDSKGCRCIFVVRYDHDHTEEKVELGRICSRPTHYSRSPMDIEAGSTQYYSQPIFELQEGIKFPF